MVSLALAITALIFAVPAFFISLYFAVKLGVMTPKPIEPLAPPEILERKQALSKLSGPEDGIPEPFDDEIPGDY